MSVNQLKVFSEGFKYSKVWPMKSQLFAVFPECRVIKATQLATRILPIIAVVTFFVQTNYLGETYAPQSLALCLLILSMPLQGYYWLGKRAQQFLPISLANWYYQIEDKLVEQGVEVKSLSHKPKYKDMAVALKLAFSELDKNWIRDWL
ncbi:terminus macrodomain insulation protein YfbV [Gayadomonas joobiniege]|uniref:terminus macrodomain insulation protein YfbV n=1 Tax=Gayadomonas joobiniege TaxID=1234606 RepID=UPI000374DD1D|nr:terminus macrodomain insulation protein YfbV [Gayadomonas joobiniege]